MSRAVQLKSGKVGYPLLMVKVFKEHNAGSFNHRIHARPGCAFTEAEISELLIKVADDLETRYPEHVWRMVEMAPNQFNFVWDGKKEKSSEQLKTEGNYILNSLTEKKDGILR